MKKSILIFSGLFFLLTIGIVAAQALPAPPVALKDIADQFKGLVSGISGDDTMVRVLLVMLLTTVLFQPAYRLLGKKSGIAFFVAFIVSVLGIKYLATYDMIKGVLLPYGALAIAITSILPFLLIGFLLETTESKLLRKIGWAIMAGSFIMLWWFRWTDIGDLAWIYLGLGLICAAVLFWFDSTLRTMLAQAGMENSRAVLDIEIANLNKELNNLYTAYANAQGNRRLEASIENQIRDKERHRANLVRLRRP
jgi:hypothetical protein